MSKNKSAREELERIYGKKCMICQGIKKLSPPQPRKGVYKGKSIARQLTYHHLVPKRLEGKTDVDNGALLCVNCHTWLEQLCNTSREQVNDELRKYKRQLSQGCQIHLVDSLDLDFEIKAFTFTVEDLKPKREYNRAKEKRKFMKEMEEDER